MALACGAKCSPLPEIVVGRTEGRSLDVDPARTGDVDRLGSSVSVGFGGVFDALPLGERSESVHDYGRLVDEDVFGAVVRSDKPEALLRIEPEKVAEGRRRDESGVKNNRRRLKKADEKGESSPLDGREGVAPFDRACDFGHEKGHGPRP